MCFIMRIKQVKMAPFRSVTLFRLTYLSVYLDICLYLFFHLSIYVKIESNFS